MSNKKELEKLQGEPVTIEIIKNSIPQIIEEFCIKNKIEDISKESSNKFNALLIEINRQLIEPNKRQLLKIEGNNNNKYDPNKLYTMLEIYSTLAMTTDNAVTITGFSLLCNMKYDTIVALQNEKTPTPQHNNITGKTVIPSMTGLEVYQKLMELEERTTLDCRKYNDLRIIARLNRITGGAYRDYTQVDTGETRAQLTTSEISDKYGALSDNNGAMLPQ